MSYSEMAQLELMNAAANVASQEDLDALRLTLSLFFAERAQQAIDKMWDEGTFDQKKLDELRGQHLRTPYKTLLYLSCATLSLTPTALYKPCQQRVSITKYGRTFWRVSIVCVSAMKY